jgi:rubrerythrin
MDVFEFAMQMEKEAENFYGRLADDTDNAGLKTIFNMLAAEEAKHYKIIKEIKEKLPQKISETDILSQAKAVFEQISKSDKNFNSGTNQVETYKKAQDIEKKSEDFYLQKATEAQDHCQQGIFRKLAEEEKKHYILLQNIIDFVSRPETWLENAEWNHLDEY